jgi:hypothetical protein
LAPTNLVHAYHVDLGADHPGCLAVFESLGNYVWSELDTFSTCIGQVRSPYALVLAFL